MVRFQPRQASVPPRAGRGDIGGRGLEAVGQAGLDLTLKIDWRDDLLGQQFAKPLRLRFVAVRDARQNRDVRRFDIDLRQSLGERILLYRHQRCVKCLRNIEPSRRDAGLL